MRLLYFIFFPLLLLVIPSPIKAQKTSSLDKYKIKYPKENMVFLSIKENVNIDLNNEEFTIYAATEERQMYLKTLPGRSAENKVRYSDFHDIVDISAHTMVPKGNGYKKIKVEEFSTKDELSSSIFFDDSKSKNFYFPGLQEGAITHLQYTEQIKEPRFLNSFFFAELVPVESAELNVICSEDVNLEFKLFNIDETTITHETQKTGNKITHKWLMKDIPKTKYESGAPNPRSYMPHIVYYIKDYKVGNETKTLLNDPGDLHRWYSSLLANLNQENSSRLKKVVDTLVSGINDDLEKVRKIYHWVQDNIKYIAFEQGLNGFIPEQAKNVYKSRYGDCKGMSSILTCMMNEAGIKSHLTWIGTRDIPYSYSEVPTPVVDNHMIATYIHNDVPYFLDATGQYNPFGYPSGFIQGKEAMLHIDSTNFKLVKVPIVESWRNSMIDSVYINIVNNNIVGHGKITLTGYYKSRITYQIADSKPEERLEYLTSYLEKGNNKFQVETASFTNLENREKPLIIEYKFNIADYVSSIDDEIYVNLNLEKFYDDAEIEKDRKIALEIDYRNENKTVLIFTIPEDYNVDYLPKSQRYKNDLFGFELDYQNTEAKITLSISHIENYLMLENANFGDWNEMVGLLQESYGEVVVLKRK